LCAEWPLLRSELYYRVDSSNRHIFLFVENDDYKDVLASLKSSLDLNPWVSHISSRYTSLLHNYQQAASGAPRRRGSLSVVHLSSDSDESLESDGDDEEGDGGDNER
jgi:hypothetical protein